MKKWLLTLSFLLISISAANAQPLERVVQSVPVFSAMAGVKAVNGVLTIGVFSEVEDQISKETLKEFETLKSWSHEKVKGVTGHTKIEVVGLNRKSLDSFKGQIIWVLAAEEDLPKLKTLTQKGVFTIGTHDKAYEKALYVTLDYENKSDDPAVERWRLTRMYVNCEICPLRFTEKLDEKDHFFGNKCE